MLAGDILAGPLVRQACQRHLDDIAAKKFRFDLDAADHVYGYFRDVLKLNGGDFEGKPFELDASQKFIVGSLFGWKDDNGNRRFRTAYCEVGKGNGKSPLGAGVGLYMLTADNEPRAEIYAAAHDKDQAKIPFRDAVAMVDQSPALDKRITRSGGPGNEWNLADLSTNSFFRPIASEHKGARGQSGPRPHMALLDELHEHPSPLMTEFLQSGTKWRRQALIFMITNSGYDRTTVCGQYHDYSKRVLSGAFKDDSFFCYVCGLDEEDDWQDEKVWIKANPLLGKTITEEYLRKQVTMAAGMPSKQGIIRRLNFCEWTAGEEGWLEPKVWASIEADDLRMEDYREYPCYLALDLASKRDLSALAILFDLGERQVAFMRFYVPEDGLIERSQRDMVPYTQWRDEGVLTVTPGSVMKFGFIAKDIADLDANFDVRALGGDDYKISEMQEELDELGCHLQIIEHPQGFRKDKKTGLWMPGSLEACEAAIFDGQLQIATHPMMRWMNDCVKIIDDPQGNRKPDKRRSNGRIDGIVGLITTYGVLRAEESRPTYQMFFVSGDQRPAELAQ